MNKIRLAGMCAGVLLLGLLIASWVSIATADTVSFPDVTPSHPYYAAIVDLASRGIIGGFDDGSFRPGDPVTRQQFAKMIVLACGYPVTERDYCYFWDVQKSGRASLYPDNYVAVCATKGITQGKSAGVFDPYGNITRYQAISMVVRAVDDLQPGLLSTPPATFTPTGSWGKDKTHGANAARAEYNRLLAGLDLTLLSPTGPMTRGEVAQVLHNLLLKLSPATTTTTAGTTTTTTAGSGSSTTTTTTTDGSTTTTDGSTTTTDSTTTTTLADAGHDGWEALEGTFTGPPCVDDWTIGGIDVFARGTDGTLWYNWYTDGDAYGWDSIGGSMAPGSRPVSVAWETTVLDVFIRGTDSALWHREISGEDWDPWESLGGSLTSDPAVASWETGRLDVFARGTSGQLMYISFDGETWSDWQDLGGTLKDGSSPAAVSSDSGQIDVFIRGTDDALWHMSGDGTTWSSWESLGGTLTSSPAACSQEPGELWICARGADNKLWSKEYSGSWSDWVNQGGAAFAGDPDASSDGFQVDVVALGADGAIWHRIWDGSSWTP